MNQFMVIACGALTSLLLLTRADASDAQSTQPSAIKIPLGKPVYAQALRYTEMFDEKPFAEALLIYLDNGSYKIISPGEDHYGSYVSDASQGADPREVQFLSWPSSDWSNNVAAHTLVFNPQTGAFSQHLRRPGTTIPLLQYGYSAAIHNPGGIDITENWKVVREKYAEIFNALAVKAEKAR